MLQKTLVRWSCALLTASLFAVAYVGALAQWGEFPFRLFDGDFVHPHLIVRDLISGGNLFEWSSSAALYAFPDWLYALTALLPIDSRAASVLSSILLLVSIMVVSGEIIRIYVRDFRIYGAIAIFGFFLILVVAAPGNYIQWLIDYAASLYIHTGAALVVLLSVIFGRRVLVFKKAPMQSSALAFVGALTVYSDPIFLPWFTMPFWFSGLVVSFAIRRFWPLYKCSMIAAIHVAAYLLERVKPFPSARSSLFLVDPLTSVRGVWGVFSAGVQTADVALILYLLTALLAIAFLSMTLSKIKDKSVKEIESQDIILCSIFLSVAALPIAVGVVDHPSKLRYIILIVYLSPIILIRSLLFFINSRFLDSAYLILSMSAVAFLVFKFPAIYTAFSSGQHEELIACLEEIGLTDGYADYDFAKPLIYLTDDRIHVSQIGHSAGTNFSNRWRTQRVDGSSFSPNFVLTRNLAAEHLEKFGEPFQVVHCPASEVWIYSATLQTASTPWP